MLPYIEFDLRWILLLRFVGALERFAGAANRRALERVRGLMDRSIWEQMRQTIGDLYPLYILQRCSLGAIFFIV